MSAEHQSDDFWGKITKDAATGLIRIYGFRESVQDAFSDYSQNLPGNSDPGIRTPIAFAAIRLAYEII